MTPAPGDEHIGLFSSSYQFATHRYSGDYEEQLPKSLGTSLAWLLGSIRISQPCFGAFFGFSWVI